MQKLIAWYRKHGRNLPWRKTTSPYKIVVSEIMLQQTQVDRVISKYEKWLRLFPTWKKLATASKVDVLKAWSGLGYNSRAIRLQLLAQVAGNKFPQTEEELKKLPGIGPYTAGAVMAFAFDKPGNFMDVNVERVLKRYLYTKRQTPKDLVGDLYDLQEEHSPRELGNALMDLGSLFCTASRPKCDSCPLFDSCKSKGERPEEEKIRIKKRQSTFLHSNRWWRGQILKLLTNAPHTSQELFKQIPGNEEKTFQEALNQLKKEGLIVGEEKISISN
jgi:A/G-specific adenine glycosylase